MASISSDNAVSVTTKPFSGEALTAPNSFFALQARKATYSTAALRRRPDLPMDCANQLLSLGDRPRAPFAIRLVRKGLHRPPHRLVPRLSAPTLTLPAEKSLPLAPRPTSHRRDRPALCVRPGHAPVNIGTRAKSRTSRQPRHTARRTWSNNHAHPIPAPDSRPGRWMKGTHQIPGRFDKRRTLHRHKPVPKAMRAEDETTTQKAPALINANDTSHESI